MNPNKIRDAATAAREAALRARGIAESLEALVRKLEDLAAAEPDVVKAAPPKPRVTSADCLWKAEDVARFLKVSRSWVYQQSEQRTLPSVKIGALVRFLPEKIYAFAGLVAEGPPTGAAPSSGRRRAASAVAPKEEGQPRALPARPMTQSTSEATA